MDPGPGVSRWGWVGSFCTSMSYTPGLLHCCYGCMAQGGDKGEGRVIDVHSGARDEVVHITEACSCSVITCFFCISKDVCEDVQ